ncbi:hypothetical protein SCOR_11250 [Sulfidibacter corallicola]|uniref:Uncharacterized protein n=1 Tax=Sulfidibacter corallicola TaxID=2818388 RepID=A0A8A4TDC1_SULCO|nr:hypothetical protein [Sulfidibacter corallicola]QTD48089.1 hypothetical protein J3U87_21095 [Sulfidibacter corallicola]
MALKSSKKEKPELSFDTEEMTWPDVEDSWTEEDLLVQTGMFKFSKIKDKLSLSTADLTKISRDALRNNINTYESYGFGKPKGSQYIVRMSLFRNFYSDYTSRKNLPTNIDLDQVQSIPTAIHNANSLIELDGYFYLKEVCAYSPFKESEEVIKNSVRSQENQEEAKNTNGCWYDETKREYFVDMQLFVPWFFGSVWVRP